MSFAHLVGPQHVDLDKAGLDGRRDLSCADLHKLLFDDSLKLMRDLVQLVQRQTLHLRRVLWGEEVLNLSYKRFDRPHVILLLRFSRDVAASRAAWPHKLR